MGNGWIVHHVAVVLYNAPHEFIPSLCKRRSLILTSPKIYTQFLREVGQDRFQENSAEEGRLVDVEALANKLVEMSKLLGYKKTLMTQRARNALELHHFPLLRRKETPGR